MKKFALLALLVSSLFSTPALALEAYFDFKVFHIPGEGPMVETYLNFFGETMTFNEVEGGEQATVEITMVFYKEDSIVSFSKTELNSKIEVDSLYDDFIDQQRFLLDYGEYVLEIELREPSNPEAVENFTEVVLLERPPGEVFFSDVQWISAFKKATEMTELTKAGYDLLPYVSNYIPQQMNTLMFYSEVYGTTTAFGEDAPFVLDYYIENFETGRPIEAVAGRNRMTSGVVIPVMKQIDISALPTGNFNLVLEVRNSENKIVATQNRFFQRAGDMEAMSPEDYAKAVDHNVFSRRITDIDTLYAYIESLVPIAGDAERSLIYRFQENKDLDLMQRFFYNFWYSRDNFEPDYAWEQYKKEVALVQERYGTANRKGYETDMGRVHLTYGAPDVITDRPAEPSAYPYQIWQYFRAAQWTNVRFVFYDRTLLRSDYELLHCDKVRGEIKNPRWDMLIHQRDTPLNNVDRTQSPNHFGGRTQDFWETPR